MLFSKDGQKDGKAKKQSLLGMMFNPGIGNDIKDIRQQTGMFVRMLASVFVANGLFPKEHPALNDTNIRLSLADVIAIAWKRLSFTREGIPQIVLFFAVSGTIVFTALMIITFLLSLMVGKAHAQGMFQAPNEATDWGIHVLDYIFLGVPILQENGTMATGNQGTLDCSMHTALSQALGFFSTAVLVLAGIILFYHLVSMIAKTAQTGRPFEGANQLWAPIRLVFAVALLVPVAGGPTNVQNACNVQGYNTGQYLAYQLARWGSGLASNAWALFANSMNVFSSGATCTVANGGVSPTTGGAMTTLPPSCPGGQQNLRNFVMGLIIADACAKFSNHYLDELYGTAGSSEYVVTDLSNVNNPLASGKHYFGYRTRTQDINDALLSWDGNIITEYESDQNHPMTVCGGYEIFEAPSANNPFTTVHQGIYGAGGPFATLMQDIDNFNTTHSNRAIEGVNYAATTTAQMIAEYQQIVDRFNAGIETQIDNAITTARNTADTSVMTEYTRIQEMGWLYAGATFNMIARVQAQKFEALRNALPVPLWPDLLKQTNRQDPPLEGILESTRTATRAYMGSLETIMRIDEDRRATAASGATAAQVTGATSGITGSITEDLLKSDNRIDSISNMLVAAGVTQGLWDTSGTLGLRFGMTENPITEITAFGQKNIVFAGIALAVAGLAAFAGSTVVGVGIGALASFVAGVLGFLATIFFSIGFTLGYLVPLFAFYRFFFGGVQWLMSVFEAIVLVPLFALAHVNPAGDGLPGPKAQYGYSLAMQLILRPVLMIFGLIAGFLLFKVLTALLTSVFAVAAIGTGNLSGFASLFGKLSYTIIYAALIYLLANQCFKPIGMFPQVALRWLGAGGVHEERFDTGTVTAAGAWIAKSGAAEVVGKVTSGLQGAGGAAKTRRLKASDDAAIAARHDIEDQNVRHTEYYQSQVLGALGHHGSQFHGQSNLSGRMGSSSSGQTGGGGSTPPTPPLPNASTPSTTPSQGGGTGNSPVQGPALPPQKN